MARTGGRFPFDKLNALTGPVRVLWALPTVAAPGDLSAIVAQVADVNGEYQTQTGWNDFGLMTDSPSLSHDRDTSGIEYEGVGQLFEKVSNVTRSFTHHVGEIDQENLKIIENTSITTAIAASAAAAPTKRAARTLVHVGLYSSFPSYRIALIAYRPDGAGVVTEPAPSNRTRPPAVGRVFTGTLSGDIGDVDFSAGDPVGVDITFNIDPDQSLGAGKEHGYWVLEQPGAILA